MDRLARDALADLNRLLAHKGAERLSAWPIATLPLGPIEQAWAFQPWVSTSPIFGHDPPCWINHGELRWWGVDGHYHARELSPKLAAFSAACDAGAYPALIR